LRTRFSPKQHHLYPPWRVVAHFFAPGYQGSSADAPTGQSHVAIWDCGFWIEGTPRLYFQSPIDSSIARCNCRDIALIMKRGVPQVSLAATDR
jgi:hypothetical protein